MAAKGGLLGAVVDDDGLVALPDLVADGGFDFKFPAGHQAEFDFVAHGTANPTLLGDACYRGEAMPGRVSRKPGGAERKRYSPLNADWWGVYVHESFGLQKACGVDRRGRVSVANGRGRGDTRTRLRGCRSRQR